MLPYSSEFAFSYTVALAPPDVVGPGPGGIRLNFRLLGGEFAGPRLKGTVLPGGTDFVTLRSDGVLDIDVRGLLKTEDGAVIDIAYKGVIDAGPDAYAGFLAGSLPAALLVRAAPRLTAAHPDYLWLNRLQFYSIGRAVPQDLKAEFDVYALV
ncbi:DUF3237 domain-containing protein [Zavarzinia compransoris]|uniref:UPF0311 protein DKG75_13230 n=1 Tax=Zavarzinia compransoris TaxID=1264899 RepID=A0A317E1G6_9PROT|nr:DUF3237 domain-containing protein [Zavarzinia compransoris]PWR20947.1 DUF3237 domain-containing protein [Zavarzinia compransoris]TDP43975.1 uncharacterized protein DUF3237 [Zavarzinia compransoris]